VGAGGVEQRRHEVLLGGGCLTDALELVFDGGGVAAGADGLDAADLLAFQGGVDSEDLDLPVAALGVAVDADELACAAVVFLLELEGGVGDLALGEAALDASTIPPSSSILAKYSYASCSMRSVNASTK